MTTTEQKNTGLWVATVLVAAVFVAAGVPKLFIYRDWLFRFALWNYPKWMVVVVGIIETIGAVAVLMPRAAFAGAAVLSCVMVGAFVTHFINREGIGMLAPVFMLALLYVILRKRKPRNLTSWLRGLTSRKNSTSD